MDDQKTNLPMYVDDEPFNWEVFNDNLTFYINNDRFADAIEMINELEIKTMENDTFFTSDMNINNNNLSLVIGDILRRLKSLESDVPNLTSMTELFGDKSLTATEKLFLQNEYKLDLSKNKILYLFLTNPNLYADLETRIDAITSSINSKNNFKFNV